MLSFPDAQLLNYSKLGVILGSLLSAATGLMLLIIIIRNQKTRPAAN